MQKVRPGGRRAGGGESGYAAEQAQDQPQPAQERGRSPPRPRGRKGEKGGQGDPDGGAVPEASLMPEGVFASSKSAAQRAPTPGRKGGKIPDKDKPCFELLHKGVCNFNPCRYSHDPDVIARAKAILEKGGKGKGKDKS